MRQYTGAVNEVYPKAIGDCLRYGSRVSVRGTETLELHPAIFELTRPTQNIVTSFGRPINIAFALAEVLWILQGRRDVEMLAFYNDSIRQFSDNGSTFDAPYGYRLRRAHGYDQIEDVIRTLLDDRGSRQAMLTMWHPDDRGWDQYIDNPDYPPDVTRRNTRDRACNVIAHLMVRDDELDWTHLVRSNDAILGVPYNFVQWTSVQEYIAHHLGIRPGRFIYVSDSFHIYTRSDYYGPDAYEHIALFDAYKHLTTPAIPMGEPALLDLYAIEEQIRAGKDVPPEDEWFDVACILRAHAAYRNHEDRAAFREAGTSDTVWGATQHRFYWQKRWHRLPDLHRDYLRKSITDLWPAPVTDWILSSS